MLDAMLARWISVAALAVVSAGCKVNDCVKLCEQNNACPGAPQSDCKQQCEAAEHLAKSSGCDAKFDDLARCSANRKDACIPGSCENEQKIYEICLHPYCLKNPSVAGCR